MAQRFLILWAGRKERGGFETLAADYRRRAARWAAIEEIPIRVGGSGADPSRRSAEGAALRKAAPSPSFWVALDRLGESLSTEELAKRVARWRREWPHPVVFFVGSDLGLDPELVRACRLRLSLGPLTLPHALARLVLTEQIYRVLSIEAGIQYHRAPFC